MIISHYHQQNLPPNFLFNDVAYIQFMANKARGLSKNLLPVNRDNIIKASAQNFHRLFYEHQLEIATLERDMVIYGFGGWINNQENETLNLKFLYSLLHEPTKPVGSVLLDFVKNQAIIKNCWGINVHTTDYAQKTEFYQKRGFKEFSGNMSDLLVWQNPHMTSPAASFNPRCPQG